MPVADSMEAAILDAIRQVPDDRLADVLSYVRSLSSNGPADPEVYAGITPGGMSFEIPAIQIKQFLRLLVDTLGVEQVTLSFRENGGFVEYIHRSETLGAALDDIEARLTDPSFMIEFEGGALYTGGDGCFSLRAPLANSQAQQLISGVLGLAGFDLYSRRKVAGAAVFDGKMVVYG